MENLEFIIVMLYLIFLTIDMFRNKSVEGFIGAIFVNAFFFGFIYVILHFLIKYW